MKIQVIGAGCANCKNLYEVTKEVVAEMGLGVEVEYVNDVQKAIEMGVMSVPVLAVDGKPVMVGFSSDKDKIKKLITGKSETEAVPSKGGCACGGKC